MRRLRCACLLAFAGLILTVATAHAATRFVEPTGSTVRVRLDASGKPEPFTIKVAGFAPEASVYVSQCDGTSPQDPKWRPSVDCDLGTQPAAIRAAADGTVTFPAGDRNFGFQPVRGESPQKLFNCLAPGDPDPHNGLPSSTACQVRVATNYVDPTADQLFLTLQFVTGSSGSSSGTNWGLVVLAIAAIAVLASAIVVVNSRRGRASTRSRSRR